MQATPCDLSDLKAFIAECDRGDPAARATFQEMYGPLIYSFPIRLHHLPADQAGDFYLYVFERDRIFHRIRTFEGRNGIHLHTYLSYYVLRDLFREWRRTTARREGGATAAGAEGLADDEPTPDIRLVAADTAKAVARTLGQLDDKKRLVLKLRALAVIELTPSDVRAIARMAARSVQETADLVAQVTAALWVRERRLPLRWTRWHKMSFHIRQLQHVLAVLEADIYISRLQGDMASVQALIQQHAAGECKLARKERRRAELWEQLRQAIAPTYKEIGEILNMPPGTVGALIARARQTFAHKLYEAQLEGL